MKDYRHGFQCQHCKNVTIGLLQPHTCDRCGKTGTVVLAYTEVTLPGWVLDLDVAAPPRNREDRGAGRARFWHKERDA